MNIPYIKLALTCWLCALFCACSNQDEPAPVIDPVMEVPESCQVVFNAFERDLCYSFLRNEMNSGTTEANFALMPTVLSQYIELNSSRSYSAAEEMRELTLYTSRQFVWIDTLNNCFANLYTPHSRDQFTNFNVFNVWSTNLEGDIRYGKSYAGVTAPFSPSILVLNNQYLSNAAIEEQLNAYKLQYLNQENIQGQSYEFLKSEDPITLDNSIVQSSILNLQLAWKHGFSGTSTKKFTNEDGSEVEVDYLHAPHCEAKRFANEYFECVALPLTDSGLEFCMVKRTSKVSLAPSLEFFIDQVLPNLKESTLEMIELSIPPVQLTSDRYLNSLLANMGVTDFFSQRESYLINDKNYQAVGVHAIHQGIHLELTQDGNEMAAKGSTPVLSEGTPAAKVEMDRAFMFFLVDTQSGIPLLGGAVRQL